jgi:hypothetical protein
VTARWVVDEVAPERDLDILWQPISLLEKNQPAEDSDYYAPVAWSHGLLRVMESLRAAEGDDAVFPLYWEYGRRIHHDGDRHFDPAESLRAVGADERHAEAKDDLSWDAVIKERMGEGLALAGDDIGTPLIAFDDANGDKVALFGPVITRVPPREQSLALWDGFVMMATTPGFWEVKRTRTERPDFGPRP